MSTRKIRKFQNSTTMAESQITVQRDHYPMDTMEREKGEPFVPYVWETVSSKWILWCWFFSGLQQVHEIIIYEKTHWKEQEKSVTITIMCFRGTKD
jgi:hypothetical protein